MAFNGNFKTVKENEIVRFEKIGYCFERDSGTSLLGWLYDKHRCTWFNYLRGLDTVYPVEEKGYNPANITLYSEGKIIGWIEKKYRKKILEAISEYLMNWRSGEQTLKSVETHRVNLEMETPKECIQMSLF